MREASEPRTKTLNLGSVIDSRYKLIASIGSGATGTVFRAKHIGIGRMVAIKLAKPELSSTPEVADRFQREALAIGLISHPNCVSVVDSGQLPDGTRFVAMELLEGFSLSDLLAKEKSLGVSRTLHITRHILRGLTHVHKAKIVHRDLKPDNIFLVEQDLDHDFAKILDFGLAKLLVEVDTANGRISKPLTRTGMTLGTPHYMSPEQICGKPVDARADLYAVAVVIYEMLTGRPPFEGDDPLAILPMHLSMTPPSFAEACPSLDAPVGLEELVMQGLSKTVDQRIPSAATFLAAIEDLCQSDWISEHTPLPAFPSVSQLDVDTHDLSAIRAVPTKLGSAKTELQLSTVEKVGIGTKTKLLMLAGGLACAALLAYAAFGGRGGNNKAELNVANESTIMVEEGNPEAAIAFLNAKKEDIEDDEESQLVLGHAYAEVKNYRLSIEAYTDAIKLDLETADDPALRETLGIVLEQGKPAMREKALGLLELIVAGTGEEKAREQLLNVASAHPKRSTRVAGRAAARRLGLADRIDLLRSYSLDLKGPGLCALRKKAVKQLRDLGDKAALPVLRESKQRWKKKRNLNSCLRVAAEAAIVELESLP